MILVPYDSSKYSNKAFEFALDFAKKTNKKLKVVTCIEIGYNTDMSYEPRFMEFWEKELRNKALNQMASLEKKAKRNNVPISCKVVKTLSVTKKLIELSNSKDVEMIIMGSHGRSGMVQLFLGSVANKVVHLAKCPVLIIK